jgi:dTDP-glucose 4,6-dehydratase
MTVYGHGEQTRSFCYVDDLIRGFRLLIDSDYKYPINLGNPTEFTISELVDKVAALYSTQSGESYIANISLKELPVDDPMQRCPDITLAKTLLGWEPTIDLDTGLKLTFGYFSKMKAGDTECVTIRILCW